MQLRVFFFHQVVQIRREKDVTRNSFQWFLNHWSVCGLGNLATPPIGTKEELCSYAIDVVADKVVNGTNPVRAFSFSRNKLRGEAGPKSIIKGIFNKYWVEVRLRKVDPSRWRIFPHIHQIL